MTEIWISSPPDRERLVADIMIDHVQMVEINHEGAELAVEIYPRPDGKPWVIPFKELLATLQEASERLEGRL